MRKTLLASALSLALISGNVYALGLGELEANSALNQPLDAEISLTTDSPTEADGAIITLASQDDFARAGIDRPQALTDLRFKVVKRSNGSPYVRVTSTQPIVEPYLQFLVEMDWPQGRLIKEYTVLLDPPTFVSQETTVGEATAAATPVASVLDDQDLSGTPVEIERLGSASDAVEEVVESAPVDDPNSGQILEDQLQSGMPLEEADQVVASTPTDVDAEDAEILQILSGQEDVEPAAPVVTERVESGVDELALASEQPATSAPVAAAAPRQTQVADETYTVKSGDTMWRLAARMKQDNSITVEQMMLAIARANKDAFVDGNINRLKKGAILRIPRDNSIYYYDQSEALTEVRKQNSLWRQATRSSGQAVISQPKADASSTPAKPTQESATAAQGADDKDRLEIVGDKQSIKNDADATSQQDSTSAGAETAEDKVALDKKLKLTREELEAEVLQNDELKSRVSSVEDTVNKMERLIELREGELSDLQNKLGDAGIETPDTDGAESTTPDETAAQPVANTPDQPAEQSFLQQLLSNPTMLAGGLGALLLLLFLLLKRRKDEKPEDDLDDAYQAAAGAGAMGGAGVTATSGEDLTKVDDTLAFDNDATRATGATLADQTLFMDRDDTMASNLESDDDALAELESTLLESATSEDETLFTDETLDVDSIDALNDPASETIAISHDEMDQMLSDDDLSSVSDDATAQSPAKDNTIAEADVYLAYGLYNQADDLLKMAIEESPNNTEYRMKLLESYHGQKNADAFTAEAETFKGLVGESDKRWAKVASLGRSLAPASALFAGAAAATELDGGALDNSFDITSFDESLADLDASLSGDEKQTIELPHEVDDLEATLNELASDSQEAEERAAEVALDPDGTLNDTLFGESVDVEAAELRDEVAVVAEDSPALTDTLLDELQDIGDTLTPADDADDSLLAADQSSHAMKALGEKLGETGADLTAGTVDDLGAEMKAAQSSDVDTLDISFNLDDLDMTGMDQASTDNVDDLDATADFTKMEDTLHIELDELDGTLASVNDKINDSSDESLTNFDSTDELDTMLDLAKAYIDMGDAESATSALKEIVDNGNDAQKSEASELLKRIS